MQLCPGDPRLFWPAWAPVLLYTYLHTDKDTDAQFKNVIQVERYFMKFNAQPHKYTEMSRYFCNVTGLC